MPDLERLTAIADEEAHAAGFALVRVAWFPGGLEGSGEPTLQVMAERATTRQLTLDDCADLSRRLSERLDPLEGSKDDPIPESYRLEVSSPGIDRPLTRRQDFVDWAGHEAKLMLATGVDPADGGSPRTALRGDLAGLDGDQVLLHERKSGHIAVPLSDILEARLILTDRLIRASRPLDSTGAEIEHEVADNE